MLLIHFYINFMKDQSVIKHLNKKGAIFLAPPTLSFEFL